MYLCSIKQIKKVKKIRITAIRQTTYPDLMAITTPHNRRIRTAIITVLEEVDEDSLLPPN